MPVYGEGAKGILIVGEFPAAEEDDKGVPFVGKSGQYLQKVLRKYGVDLKRDCWSTNAARCRPEKNELPSIAVDHCRPFVQKAIKELQPKTIILLGTAAVKSVIGMVWKEDDSGEGVTRWVGWQIPNREPNAWICPTFHPSYCIRMDDAGNTVPGMFFERHIAAALEKEDRPWEVVPDYAAKVKRIYSGDAAASEIAQFAKSRAFAFDYETDRLKPDPSDSRIVCCAISDGARTISFPWQGKAIDAMRELLVTPVPKIGANSKFESRWTKRHLGVTVKNWWWDTVLGAHWMDNRRKITSVKFQAFVLLGQPSYNDHLERLLREPLIKGKKGANFPNRIKEIDVKDLLLYAGIDALVEYKLALVQMRRMNYPRPEGIK